jgi:hypothetical protein
VKTNYRVTTDRPVAGRMRSAGDTVALTAAEYKAEAPWGGLEPVKAAKAAPAEAPPAASESGGSRGSRKG